jgi:hypothetical protein
VALAAVVFTAVVLAAAVGAVAAGDGADRPLGHSALASVLGLAGAYAADWGPGWGWHGGPGWGADACVGWQRVWTGWGWRLVPVNVC